MTTTITTEAQAGFDDGATRTNQHLFSSAAWMAHEAGNALYNRGFTRPVKATMGRGYSINIWTAANQFIVRFSKALIVCEVERKG